MTDAFLIKLLEYRPVTFLIRHAERHSLKGAKHPDEALLTEKGEDDARQYGRDMISFSPLTIYHSPITRCRQTAEAIHKGIVEAGGDGAIAGTIEGLEGVCLSGDFERLKAEVIKYTFAGFARKWFDGEVGEAVMPAPEEAARFGLSILRRYHGTGGRSTVMVSHDWNIMILREFCLGLRHEDIGFPGFLEGVAYYLRGGRGFLAGSGKEVPVETVT